MGREMGIFGLKTDRRYIRIFSDGTRDRSGLKFRAAVNTPLRRGPFSVSISF